MTTSYGVRAGNLCNISNNNQAHSSGVTFHVNHQKKEQENWQQSEQNEKTNIQRLKKSYDCQKQHQYNITISHKEINHL